ncbi:hypothetical protein [Alkalibaculum bacchi]|uniref:hypothetical protein n=1 Tax=Alkalibaculum bacchi TaxID=645887 RepID=UPI0026F25F69|nr:hypothetical protein [Alkalibaculum bacchi]
MKKYTKALIIVALLLIGITVCRWKSNQVRRTNSSMYLGYFTQVPPNYEELLQETYGESPYYANFGDVKISIEKTIKEKYYIVYSWVNGDQSYFAVNSIIENTKKNKLNKDDFHSMYIKDDKGNTLFPLPYYSIVDFPSDQPLGWKQILYVKFYPLDKDVKTIDIYITYKGEQKVIEDVPVS